MENKYTFNLNEFNSLLAYYNLSKKDLAEYLGISTRTIFIKIKKGDFNLRELQKLMVLFKPSEVMKVMFYEEQETAHEN